MRIRMLTITLLAGLLGHVGAPAADAQNLTISPGTVAGGFLATGNITGAPAGTIIFIGASHPAVSAPATVTIPPFGNSVTFFVFTNPTPADVTVPITAGFTPSVPFDTETLTVRAPRIASLIASPDSTAGGDSSQLQLALTSPAPTGGLTLPLSNSNPNLADAPASIFVPSGAVSASVTVNTVGVSTNAFTILETSLLDSVGMDRLVVTPAQLVSAEILDPQAVPGMKTTLRITLEGEAIDCDRILSFSADSSRGSETVILPPGARIPPGSSTVDVPVILPNTEECLVVDITVTDTSDGSSVEERVTLRGINDEVEFNLPFQCNSDVSTGVVIADMDGDGDNDVLSAIGGAAGIDPGVEVFPNDGIGRLPDDSAWDYTDDALRDIIDLDARDVINNDGFPDPIILNRSNATVTVLENQRFGFERAWNARTEVRPIALTTGDVNADGIMDYVVTSETLNSVEVLRGFGNGAATTGPVSSGPFPADVTLGYINSDPYLDAITGCYGTGGVGQVGIHYGDSAATLSSPMFIDLDAPVTAVVAADFDADGDDDIAACTAAAEIFIILNDATIRPIERHAINAIATDIRAVDVEDDGDIDLVFSCDGAHEAGVLLNTGCGLFDPLDPIMLPVDSGPRLAVGHLNRDDRIDVVLTRPQEDEVLEVLQLGQPCATYIVMTIHGQDAQGFNPLWKEEDPTNPHGWPNADSNPATTQGPMFDELETFVDEINYIRTERAGLCPIRLLTHEFDWVNMTGRGQRAILASRFFFMMTFLTSDLGDIPLVAAGLASEFLGRLQTATASREAAGLAMDDLRDLVEQARYLDPEAPIFIDIVCHSRGTTVTSELLRRLVAEGDMPLGEGVSLSVSYISVIEPLFPFGIPRPGASAGDLMGDPFVDRHASETRIAHFFENRACITSGGICVGNQFFGIDFSTWINTLGISMPLDALVEFAGYPKSIGDPSLAPDVQSLVASDHNSIVAQFSFISPIDVGLPATIPVGPPSRACPHIPCSTSPGLHTSVT